MSERKRRKQATRELAPTYRPQLPAGWLWPTGDEGRGGLTAVEEAEIANTPRPVKGDQQAQAEHAIQAARADPAAPADLLPTAITLNQGGIPQFHPAMLRLLTGERALTEEEHRWRLLLLDLERTSPPAYALVAARWLDGRSDRAIARELGGSDKTIARMIDHVAQRLLAQYQALYGHRPLDK
jgi:DNA-directed RNA polymerase specialized sigma24 family protein